jgi:hypothetical protein
LRIEVDYTCHLPKMSLASLSLFLVLSSLPPVGSGAAAAGGVGGCRYHCVLCCGGDGGGEVARGRGIEVETEVSQREKEESLSFVRLEKEVARELEFLDTSTSSPSRQLLPKVKRGVARP